MRKSVTGGKISGEILPNFENTLKTAQIEGEIPAIDLKSRKWATSPRLTGKSPLIYTHRCNIQQFNRKISAYFKAAGHSDKDKTSCFDISI
jgi:hypothetical protein